MRIYINTILLRRMFLLFNTHTRMVLYAVTGLMFVLPGLTLKMIPLLQTFYAIAALRCCSCLCFALVVPALQAHSKQKPTTVAMQQECPVQNLAMFLNKCVLYIMCTCTYTFNTYKHKHIHTHSCCFCACL